MIEIYRLMSAWPLTSDRSRYRPLTLWQLLQLGWALRKQLKGYV